MVDEETQLIRDEVLRAMAEQGEDLEALGLDELAVPGGEAASVPLPDWGAVAEAASDMRNADPLAGEATMSAEDVERLFMSAVLDDVRVQSADGRLVSPSEWLDAGLVPGHCSTDEWEMYVYEYLEGCAAERSRAETAAIQTAVPIRTATRTVGVPRMMRGAEPELESELEPETTQADVSAAVHGAARPVGPDAPASVELPAASQALPCDDIVALVGKHSYYLYSTKHMTDAYARWAFLASEDDRVLTFVECVRDESRKYPRPMEASSLSNEPFNLSDEEIEALWETVRESGAYPDIETLTASNGDVYYFSTDHLTPRYAASLAEWNSVERDMFL